MTNDRPSPPHFIERCYRCNRKCVVVPEDAGHRVVCTLCSAPVWDEPEDAHVELPCTCPILTMRKGWIDFGCRGDGQAWITSPTCVAHGADYRPCKPGCRCRLHAVEEAGPT